MPSGRANRIYLTGFMGCGKSTLAPALAARIGCDPIDLDREIELREGMSVAGIFSARGEAHFRSVERDLLTGIAARQSFVAALGGGTVAARANLSLIKSTGVLVWLRTDFEILRRRLEGRTDRPMLPGPAPAAAAGAIAPVKPWLETMSELMRQRIPFYRQADITIDTDRSADPETGIRLSVDAIVSALKYS